MQLPMQTQPIDRHHRNGLSNTITSGIFPSEDIYKSYDTTDCADESVGKGNNNPCGMIRGVLAYKVKRRGKLTYGPCTPCQ